MIKAIGENARACLLVTFPNARYHSGMLIHLRKTS